MTVIINNPNKHLLDYGFGPHGFGIYIREMVSLKEIAFIPDEESWKARARTLDKSSIYTVFGYKK